MRASWSGPARVSLLGVLVAAVVLSPSTGWGQGVLDGFRRGMRSQSAFVRGKALYEAADYERARERLLETLTIETSHDEARALLGWSQYFLGEYRAAILTFKVGIRRQPDWEGLYNGLGWSRFRLRRYHLATEAFRAALDRNPDFVDAMIGLGSAQFELGRYDEALPQFQTAARRLEPVLGEPPSELAGVRAKLAWTLYYLGRYQQALDLFERTLRTRPDWHGLHDGLGWCHLKLGHKAEARAAFQRALAIRPDYDDALEGLRQAS